MAWPQGCTQEFPMPSRVVVHVYKSHEQRGWWIAKSTFFARNVESGEPDSFMLKTRWQRRPTRQQVARVVVRHLAHEVYEQLDLKPHQRRRKRRA
jgi:hypothetical protein